MSRMILDAGAFVAYEKGDPRVRARLLAARSQGLDVTSTSPVIAQVWRDGRRQARVARLIAATRVEAPDERTARRAGELLGKTKTTDVVDALVVALARDGDSIVTSDVADLSKLLTAAGVRATLLAT